MMLENLSILGIFILIIIFVYKAGQLGIDEKEKEIMKLKSEIITYLSNDFQIRKRLGHQLAKFENELLKDNNLIKIENEDRIYIIKKDVRVIDRKEFEKEKEIDRLNDLWKKGKPIEKENK